MPELLTRTDDAGWMTPAIAEVLLPLPPLPYNEAFLSDQIKTITRVLEEAEAPVQVIGRVPLPSHTLFALQPGEVGRRRDRRPVTVEAVRAALPKLASALEAEAVGVLPKLRRAPDAIGLLVRNADHRPLVLRTLLAQPGFQESESTTSLALGLDLEHTVLVRDLRTLSHLLIVGAGAPKSHYIHTLLTNLLLFNTPSELQMALIGDDPSVLRPYVDAPHLMGRPLHGLEEGRVALQRMAKEIGRRETLFEEQDIDTLHTYNVRALNAGQDALPVLLLLVDVEWSGPSDAWGPALSHILSKGPGVGVYVIAAAPSSDALPPPVLAPFGGWVVLRTAPGEIEKLPPLPDFPLRFVDALLVQDETISALEQCTIAPDEVLAVVEYWKQAAEKQAAPMEQAPPGTGPLDMPGTGPLGEAEPYISMEVGATQRVASEAEQMQNIILPRARALAAYLGWLSAGPLREILGLTDQQAENVMEQLRSEGLLEPKIAPTLRYQRLEPPPE